MSTRKRLTVVIQTDKTTTAKQIKKTVESLHANKLTYPLQIVVVGAEVAGASSENVEIEKVATMDEVVVRGDYVNVVTAGDTWNAESLEKVEEYLHFHKVDLLEENIKQTPDKKGVIWRFLETEAESFQTSLAAIWVRTCYFEQVKEIAKQDLLGKIEKLTNLYIEIRTYLCVSDIHVNQKKIKFQAEKDWIEGRVEAVVARLREASISRYEESIPYIEFVIMNLIAACLKSPLSKKVNDHFEAFVKANIESMNDMVLSKGGLNAALRMLVFDLKYGEKVWADLKYRKGKVKLYNLIVLNMERACLIKDIHITKNGKEVNVIVDVKNPLNSECTYYVKDEEGTCYPLEKEEGYQSDDQTICMGHVILESVRYKAVVPAEHADDLTYGLVFHRLYDMEMRMKEKV